MDNSRVYTYKTPIRTSDTIQSQISPKYNSQIPTTEILDDTSTSKYKKLWKRAHIRIRTAIRISKVMKNLRLLNIKSLKEVTTEMDFNDLPSELLCQEKIFNPSDPIPKLMLHPSKGFSSYWNIFLGLCLLYTAISVPFLLAFVSSRDFDVWFILDMMLSAVFMLDLILTINTPYFESDGSLVVSRVKIFKRYLKGWFAIDLLACIPFDLVVYLINPQNERSSYNRLTKLARLKNVPRLFRLSKLLVYFRNNKHFQFLDSFYYFFNFSTSMVKFFNTVCMILLSLHIFACLWYFSAKIDDFGPETWIYRKGLIDISVFDSYMYSLYWAVVTLTTIGYGDIYPETSLELFLSMIWMLVALYFISFSISSLTTMIGEKDSGRNKQMHKNLTQLDLYSKENNLPRRLKVRMQKIIKEASEKNFYNFSEKQAMLEELTPSLRMQIISNAHYGALSLFKTLQRGEDFLYSIVPLLKTESVDAGRVLYSEGEPCKNIFFMIHGKANFLTAAGLMFKVLGPGCYCGDVEVMNNVTRIFTVKVMEYSVFWVLGTEVLKKIEKDFPNVFEELKKEAERRFDEIVYQLSEIKAMEFVDFSKGIDFDNVRTLIQKQFANLSEHYRIRTRSKNSVSRIEIKLGKCEKEISVNSQLMKDVQHLLKQLAELANRDQ